MKKLDKPQFILIISCLNKVDNQEVISSSAILFESFKEALEYAREDAKTYKHLVSTYKDENGKEIHEYLWDDGAHLYISNAEDIIDNLIGFVLKLEAALLGEEK